MASLLTSCHRKAESCPGPGAASFFHCLRLEIQIRRFSQKTMRPTNKASIQASQVEIHHSYGFKFCDRVLGQESAGEVVVRVEQRAFESTNGTARQVPGQGQGLLGQSQTQAEGDDEGAEDELAEQEMMGVKVLMILMPPSHTPDQVLANGAVHPAPRMHLTKAEGSHSLACIRPHVLREVKVVLHQASVGMQRGISTRWKMPLMHADFGLTYRLPHPENSSRRHTLSLLSRAGDLQVVPETRQRAGDEAAWSNQ